MKLLRLLLLLLAAAAALPPVAAAQQGLLFGVDDDSLKWTSRPGPLYQTYAGLGLDAVRITLDWQPGTVFLSRTSQTELNRVGQASRRLRVVVAIGGPATSPPVDAAGRSSFCGYAAGVLRRYPSIHDVAIWTEPNSSAFWLPQKGAAAAYEALLASCWDALHAVQPLANVIATSSPHSKPADWYRDLGAAYRASGRALPIFDTVGHNGYPESSAESPSQRHTKGSIDQGDLDRLLTALSSAFKGTAQPVPGQGRVTVWYLEDGFQSRPAPGAGGYSGRETDRAPVSEDQQGKQLADAVRLAYCQPAVGAFFNFELRDDPDLSGWQSGLLRADWSVKPAFAAYQEAIAEARAGTIACAPK